MNLENIYKQNSKSLVLAILFSMVIFCLVVLLDIPVARQVIGFCYLTFVPGFVLMNILKLDRFNNLEKILLSVGFSIAILMIVGVLVNEFAPTFGFSEPLSLVPLMVPLNIFVLMGTVFIYFKRNDVKRGSFELTKIPISSLFFIGLPILSVLGALYVNLYQNNILLLFLILSITILFVFSLFSKKFMPSNLYPLALLTFAISILFHTSLISKYIVSFGSDVPFEYFLFQTTQNSSYWSGELSSSLVLGLGTYNDMLSITILPTIFSNLLNLEASLVFKVLYPLIFSLVPLVLYHVWQTQVSKKYAFVAAFIFMSQMTFYVEMLGLNRQMIAELFFGLLLLIILTNKVKPINKLTCFLIFSFALITSHYALAIIFLAFLSFTSLLLIVLKRPSKKITLEMVVIFLVLMFLWYIYTAESSSFQTIIWKVNYVIGQLGGFLDLSSRGMTILTGLGLAESPSVWNTISRIFAYIVQGLIVVGFLDLYSRRKNIKIEKEYFLFTAGSITLLAMLIIVPGLANTLNMTRFYHILLFFLAPLCVIGANSIVKLFSKVPKEHVVFALLVLVLVPYFLFQTNFVYEVTGSDSWSVPLSGYRIDPARVYGHDGFTDDYSVYGAHWFAKNVDYENSTVYTDQRTALNILPIHALIPTGTITLSNITVLDDNGIIFLTSLTVIYDVVPYGDISWNTSDLSFTFDGLNKIYANGGSEVYQKP